MSRRLAHDWFPGALPENVKLGERNWLYSSFAFRRYRSQRPVGVATGPDTGLYNGTLFDLGPDGEVSIGAFTTLVGAIICTNQHIVIGNYVFIAHEVVLADQADAVPASDVSPWGAGSDPTGSGRGITIGDDVWIGARAVILGGAHIGVGAIIGACALVTGEVPPYAVVAGNPGRVVAVRAPRQHHEGIDGPAAGPANPH